MKKTICALLLMVCCAVAVAQNPYRKYTQQLPFAMSEMATPKIPNREVRLNQYAADNTGKTLDEAIRCWKYKKRLKGRHRYERSDLTALEEK